MCCPKNYCRFFAIEFDYIVLRENVTILPYIHNVRCNGHNYVTFLHIPYSRLSVLSILMHGVISLIDGTKYVHI